MSPGATIQVGTGSAGILPAPVGILPTGLKGRDMEPSLSEMRRCLGLAGRMPARTGKMPALPRNATLGASP
jgi:hypothetical protein